MSPKATPEGIIKHRVLLELGASRDLIVWNHPTGVGVPLSTLPQEFRRSTVTYGRVGSGDVIGCMRMVVTEAMVGRVIGQAIMVETKADSGRQRPEQATFEQAWRWRGGLYILARDTDSVLDALTSFAGYAPDELGSVR